MFSQDWVLICSSQKIRKKNSDTELYFLPCKPIYNTLYQESKIDIHPYKFMKPLWAQKK